MSSRDSRKPPESTPHAVDLRSDPLGLARAQARSPGDPEPQVWALYPLLRPQAEAAAEPPPPDLLRLLPEVARRGRRAIAIGLLAGLAFAAAYLFVAAPIYIVKAVVQVEYRRSVIRDVEARPGSTYVGTQSEVMQSPALIEAAIRAIGLPEPEPPGIIDRVRDWVEALNPFRSDEVVDPIARAVLATLPALQASPVLGTDVLTLTLRTDAPQRGVRLLDALVASYRTYVRENETAVHREGFDLLRGREATLAAQIAEAGASYRERESAIRSLGTGADALMVHRLELEEHAKARVGAEGRRIDLENELAALREQSDASVATAQIEEDLARSEAALAELRARLSERHPDVVQMEQRVAGLRAQTLAGARSRISELERQTRAARRTEAALKGTYDREWERVKDLERERSELDRLGAELALLEQQRGAVQALLGEKELALLAAQGGENSGTLVHVLQAPAIPPDPVWPLPVPVLAACSLVGLVGGLAYALYAQGYLSIWRTPANERASEAPGFDAPLPRIPQRSLQEH